MRRGRIFRQKAVALAVVAQCIAPSGDALADCADHPSIVILEQTASSLLHRLDQTARANNFSRDSLYVFDTNQDLARSKPADKGALGEQGLDTGDLLARLEQIAKRARSGDLAAARALAADPALDAALLRLKNFVADGCEISEEQARVEKSQFSYGRNGAPDGVSVLEFRGFSDPAKYALIIAAAMLLIIFLRAFKYSYGLAYSLIFQRYNCFVPAKIVSPNGENRSFGRVIIVGKKGVRFVPNEPASMKFLSGENFGAPARVLIADREHKASLFAYSGEVAGFLFEKPIGMQILSAILASSKTKPTRCSEARNSLAAARRLMDERMRPDIERLKLGGESV